MPIRFKHRVEYAALRITQIVALALPERLALGLGWGAAWVAFYVIRYQRHETLRRIHAVFGPEMTPRRARRIAWISLRNMAFNAVEMLCAPAWKPDAMRARSDGFDDLVEQMRALVARHGGLVVAVPHMGNWDLAGVACLQAGIPLFSIAARQRNPKVNDLINRMRRVTGMVMLERGAGAMRAVLTRLRHGEALAILPDVRMRSPDVPIRFLGSTANLGRGMAQFARAAGVPILPVIITRQGWRRLRFRLCPPVMSDPGLDKAADIRKMTQHVLDAIDAAIRETPEQWFWYNRRWVLEPLGAHE